MSTVVTAEFDSLDLAELASSKIRHLGGVENVKTSKNRFSHNHDEHSYDDVAAIPGAIPPLGGGYSNMNVIPPIEFAPPDSQIRNSEIGKREEAYLSVYVSSANVAENISHTLTSCGGRKVRTIENI